MIFANATGRPAPYAPRAQESQPDYRHRSIAELRKRVRAIVAGRKTGMTFHALAEQHGVTGNRVRQIYERAIRRPPTVRLKRWKKRPFDPRKRVYLPL
jgi:DNA-directed RNA polymerase sigma subunit (sigma70/sigma32)